MKNKLIYFITQVPSSWCVSGGVCDDGRLRKHISSRLQILRTDRGHFLRTGVPLEEVTSKPGECYTSLMFSAWRDAVRTMLLA